MLPSTVSPALRDDGRLVPRSRSLLHLVLEAQERAETYRQGPALLGASRIIAEQAESLGYPSLVAASGLAERLLGSALTLRDDLSATSITRPNAGSHVLLVDVAVASALSLEVTAQRVRSLGANRIDGLIIDPIGVEASFVCSSLRGLRLVTVT